MADEEKELMADEEETIVTFVDEDGNEEDYIEEMVLEVDGKQFALLIPICDDEEAETEHEHHDDCCCCEDEADEAFFAKIIINEKGEEEYVMPTDEEFEAACKAYDELMDDEEE